MIVVSNASPLIACENVGLGDVFEALFGEVYIPLAVRQEVFAGRSLPGWVREQELAYSVATQLLQGRLGPGERASLALALE